MHDCVRAVRLFDYPVYLVLVDTPGFNDTNIKSDLEILQMISDWLQTVSSTLFSVCRFVFEKELFRYEKKFKLAGIIYLHPITDNQMAGPPYRNLRMFGELCGDQAARKVALVNTMSDKAL